MSDLVFAPQQVVLLIIDAGAHKVHAVVLYSEVEISKPEHQPGPRQGQSGRKDSKRKQSKNVKKNKKIKAFTLKKINMEILDKYTN